MRRCGVDEPVDVNENNGTQTNKPVILVPGLGGSALDADISFDKSRASILCPKKKRFHIWFSVLEVFNQRCQFEELTLPYNDTTKMFSSTHPGIKINPLDFGGVRYQVIILTPVQHSACVICLLSHSKFRF